MTKRCQKIIKTRVAEVLYQIRILKNLSVRKTAELLDVSHTLVNHLELGRANVTNNYIELFLGRLKISKEEWNMLLQRNPESQIPFKNILEED